MTNADIVEIQAKKIRTLLLENGHIRHRLSTIKVWCSANIERKTPAAELCGSIIGFLDEPITVERHDDIENS